MKTTASMTGVEREKYQRFLAAAAERLARDREHLAQLRTRFHLAVAGDENAPPKNLATLYSQVRVCDLNSGRTHVETVALPPEAEVLASRRALSSWAGPLLLGAREGDEVQWLNGGTLQRLRIEEVLRQPGVAVPPPVFSAQASPDGTRNVAAIAAGSRQLAQH